MRRLHLTALAAAALAAAPAAAHPHVWIDVSLAAEIDAGSLRAVEVTWRFDEFFSEVVLMDFDLDGDGAFDEAETEQLVAQAFAGIEELAYFAHLRHGAAGAAWGEAADFRAAVEDGRLTYRFVVMPTEPLDLAAAPAAISLYDESFYIAVDLAPGAEIALSDPACRAETGEEALDALAAFGVKPTVIRIACDGAS